LRRAAIVAPLRTPVGAFGGMLRPLTADQLAVHVIRAALRRAALPAEWIDEVVVA
jgi:acetyl-CoA C-acetyltransferase